MLKTILVFFCALTSALSIFPAYAQDFSALKHTGTARVIEVITPYTVQLDNGMIVRLSGVHFPDYSVESAGELSFTAVKILKDMLVKKSVDIYQSADSTLGRQNRMGHSLAHLQQHGGEALWAQGVLLSLGLAQVRTTQRNPGMAAQLYALEEIGRAERLGVWADGNAVLTPEGAASHVGRFGIVEGEIVNVAMNNNRLYMNFGGNWREDFTIVIEPSDVRHFSTASLDPLQWGGKRVRVRGWIKDYNGPMIEVDHPEAIEMLDSSR